MPQDVDNRGIIQPKPQSAFVEVRSATGQLLCRYNPQTHEVEIKHRQGQPVVVDLKQYQATRDRQ